MRRGASFPRAAVGLVALGVAMAAAAAGWLPVPLAATMLGASGVSYFMYLIDKTAAQRGGRRTPESSLHLVDLLGGWPGALVAQQQFRHKTAKASFQFAFWCSVLANIAIVAWLVRSGIARSLTDALLGV